ncbi:MAG: hypothetical protein K2X81_25075 [Candidatus Obscuribacterales bacterium]|nr:hypothetical protein [Candidatus Obscuribacterales bacterium]
MQKTCSRCNIEKPEKEFSCRNLKTGDLQRNCKQCCSELSKSHYKKNKQYYLEETKLNRKLNRIKNRIKIEDYFLTHPCIDCGEKDPIVLQFDHVRGKKKAGISEMLGTGQCWPSIAKEIEKCEVRCSNCHLRKTSKQFNWNKSREEQKKFLEEIEAKRNKPRECQFCCASEDEKEFVKNRRSCKECYKTHMKKVMQLRRNK